MNTSTRIWTRSQFMLPWFCAPHQVNKDPTCNPTSSSSSQKDQNQDWTLLGPWMQLVSTIRLDIKMRIPGASKWTFSSCGRGTGSRIWATRRMPRLCYFWMDITPTWMFFSQQWRMESWLFCMLAHSTHLVQPNDKSVNKHFKQNLDDQLAKMASNDLVVSNYDLAYLYKIV